MFFHIARLGEAGRGLKTWVFAYGEAWARPGEAHHIARIRVCSTESEAVGDSGIIILLKESHVASPLCPLYTLSN